jgi:hypothetical protein
MGLRTQQDMGSLGLLQTTQASLQTQHTDLISWSMEQRENFICSTIIIAPFLSPPGTRFVLLCINGLLHFCTI